MTKDKSDKDTKAEAKPEGDDWKRDYSYMRRSESRKGRPRRERKPSR